MIPSMLGFSSDFGLEEIKNQIDVNNYFSFFSITLLASGMLFELPMISYILSKVGILTPQFLRKYRRHGILIMMILAAMLTPTTDPFSMMIFATPLFGLYEISIWISKFTVGKREKAKDEAEKKQEEEDKEQE
jgi:sec-independent protein translocase protein TatC